MVGNTIDVRRVLSGILVCLVLLCGLAGEVFPDVCSLKDPEPGDPPALEHRLETGHFVLRWTDRSTHAADNMPDPEVIRETGEYLETAWEKYTAAFGRTPYVAPGSGKIEVLFYDLNCFGMADPPESPIRFDSKSWLEKPGIRRPTSAHELFHKLQYAFGYRTKWQPESPFKWFSEGTAAWAEVFVWRQVSASYKIRELMGNPNRDLFESEDCSLPFWMFFQDRCRDERCSNPMADLLRAYESTGDERRSLETVIAQRAGGIDDFFGQFSLNLRTGLWRDVPASGRPCGEVLGPDGKRIAPALGINEILLERGDSFQTKGPVERLGSRYFRFVLADSLQGRGISLSVESSSPDGQSCTLVLEKNGNRVRDVSLQGTPWKVEFSGIVDLRSADSLLLVVSGKMRGGNCAIRVAGG